MCKLGEGAGGGFIVCESLNKDRATWSYVITDV